MSSAFRFAVKLLRSAWRAGELRILLVSVMLAVAATSAVGLFTSRVQSVLEHQGNLLLGADLRIAAHHSLPALYEAEAQRRKLRVAHTLAFPSMVTHGDVSALAEIKAVSDGYPLRGQLSVSDTAVSVMRPAPGIPASGEAWVDARLAGLVGVQQGDRITLGGRELKVTLLLRQESDRGGDLFSVAPRLLMNRQDVAGTGLIQYGSHVSYHLLAAGEDSAVVGLRDWLRPRLKVGERVEDVRDARPEMRNVLDKTRQFLGLSAMAGVVLAMVAMAFAALHFAQRNQEVCAMMRCFGASQSDILRVFALQMLLLGLVGGLAGCAAGYASQAVLGELAGRIFMEQLPAPSFLPAIYSMAIGLVILFGVITPHLLQLRNVPALRILRGETGQPGRLGWVTWTPGIAVAVALVFMQAGDARLGWMTVLGFCGFLAVAGVVSTGMMVLLRRCNFTGSWRLGLANLTRRPIFGIAQVTGFGLALMALLLLTVVREDLFANWRTTLPPDAPNRFVINIQPDQILPLRDFFRREHLPDLPLFPMIKGRLVVINGLPLDPARYPDERARHLAEREFNLSWASAMQADNRIMAGRWWRQDESGRAWLSLEQGIAQTLGIRLGDKLIYDIGGERVELAVTSLRKVEWDSMRANFFAVTTPGALQRFPASYITSFYLPSDREAVLNHLVRAFPNLTVIDIAVIVAQVRAVMDRMAYAVEFVFLFCLAGGLAVLYAALNATRDERMVEAALLRVLGAGRWQIGSALLAEYALVGLLAGLQAVVSASAVGYYLGTHVLNVPYVFDPMLLVWGLGVSTVLIPAVAWARLRPVLGMPPRVVLQSA